MPNDNKNKQGTSPLVVAAAIGVGALAAVGSYFLGREHGQNETHTAGPSSRSPRASPPLVQSQQTTVYKQATKKKLDDDEYQAQECGICFREFSQVKDNNEEIHTTPCGHIYCYHCLSHSLRRDPRCPFCRSPVEPNQTLRVYLP